MSVHSVPKSISWVKCDSINE